MKNTPSPEGAAHAAMRSWRELRELADFAARRYGYGNSDGGFGIIYPGDLDTSDRVADGLLIPAGLVTPHGFWGTDRGRGGYDVLASERVYLTILADEVAMVGRLYGEGRERAGLADMLPNQQA